MEGAAPGVLGPALHMQLVDSARCFVRPGFGDWRDSGPGTEGPGLAGFVPGRGSQPDGSLVAALVPEQKRVNHSGALPQFVLSRHAAGRREDYCLHRGGGRRVPLMAIRREGCWL